MDTFRQWWQIAWVQPLHIQIGKASGFVFHGEFADTFAFIPDECVILQGDDISLDEQKYFVSGWARKNLLLNTAETLGSRLFPLRPVWSKDTPGVTEFLKRLSHLR